MPEQRSAIVTGASSGIGRAIAVDFGHLGWRVALGAGRQDRLEDTADAVRAPPGARRATCPSTCVIPTRSRLSSPPRSPGSVRSTCW